ncbi:MAG: hypothetical protein HGB04_06480 [Chlorobiaceae bacterium]|nr:hypothetical protein [Chlorobiaceae bacterium]
MDWIIERAKEPSTIRGLIILAGAAGLNVAPNLSNAIIVTFGALAGLFEIIRKEAK